MNKDALDYIRTIIENILVNLVSVLSTAERQLVSTLFQLAKEYGFTVRFIQSIKIYDR